MDGRDYEEIVRLRAHVPQSRECLVLALVLAPLTANGEGMREKRPNLVFGEGGFFVRPTMNMFFRDGDFIVLPGVALGGRF